MALLTRLSAGDDDDSNELRAGTIWTSTVCVVVLVVSVTVYDGDVVVVDRDDGNSGGSTMK